MVDASAIESALESLRPGLNADGFELRSGAVDAGNNVQVILEAKADACLDCLVPEDLMVGMIDAAIRRQDPSLGGVELIKEGFETLPSH